MISKFLNMCKYVLGFLVNSCLLGMEFSDYNTFSHEFSIVCFGGNVPVYHWIFLSSNGDREYVDSRSGFIPLLSITTSVMNEKSGPKGSSFTKIT